MLRIFRGKRIYENIIFSKPFSSIISKCQPNGLEIVMDGSNFDIHCNGKLKTTYSDCSYKSGDFRFGVCARLVKLGTLDNPIYWN